MVCAGMYTSFALMACFNGLIELCTGSWDETLLGPVVPRIECPV